MMFFSLRYPGINKEFFLNGCRNGKQKEERSFCPPNSSLLFLPLLAASSAPSAAQYVSASLPAAASCTPPAHGAAAPAAAAVSEEPQTVPCFPAAVSGNHVGGLILQAH